MLLINNTLTKQTGTIFGTVRIRISQSISVLAASAFLAAACTPSVQRFSITDFGAENGTVCTEAIQQALDKASEAGGGQVVIPEGTFLSATLYLRDNVDLHLEEGAILQGVQDPDAYQPYIPENDLTRYDSGNGTANSNCVNDRQWMKAFLIGAGVKNASITGSGTIDGVHVFDERGEENMRGPHTIIVAEAENFHMSGVHITRAANYAFLGYALVKPVFEDLLVTEGWDGIHIRGCENGVIRRSNTGNHRIILVKADHECCRCRCQHGDDASDRAVDKVCCAAAGEAEDHQEVRCTEAIHVGVSQTDIEAADCAADHKGDQGFLVLEADTVKCRFCNTADDARDEVTEAERLLFFVSDTKECAKGDSEGSSCRAECCGPDHCLITGCHIDVQNCDYHHNVHTGHDQEFPDCCDHCYCDEAADITERDQCSRYIQANIRTERSQEAEGDRKHDQDREERYEDRTSSPLQLLP